MNTYMTLMRARGLGADPYTYIDSSGNTFNPDDNGGSGSGHSTRDAIFGLAGQGLNLLGNIFGHQQQQTTGSGLTLAQQQALLAAQQQVAAGSRPSGPGVGVGVDGSGIRLSDGTHISWPTIGIAVVGLVLLQSRGFSRR